MESWVTLPESHGVPLECAAVRQRLCLLVLERDPILAMLSLSYGHKWSRTHTHTDTKRCQTIYKSYNIITSNLH